MSFRDDGLLSPGREALTVSSAWYSTVWFALDADPAARCVALAGGQRVRAFCYGVGQAIPPDAAGRPELAPLLGWASEADTSCEQDGACRPADDPDSTGYALRVDAVAARVLAPRVLIAPDPAAAPSSRPAPHPSVGDPGWLRAAGRSVRAHVADAVTLAVRYEDEAAEYLLGTLTAMPLLRGASALRIPRVAPDAPAPVMLTPPGSPLPLRRPFFAGGVRRRPGDASPSWCANIVLLGHGGLRSECRRMPDAVGTLVVPVRLWLFGPLYDLAALAALGRGSRPIS